MKLARIVLHRFTIAASIAAALACTGAAAQQAAPSPAQQGAPAGGARADATNARAGANPQVLLLGEVHDNVAGHRQRYEELRQRVEAGWRPAIVMEQFNREDQGVLSKAQAGCLDAQCVIRVVGGPGWDWQLYYPVIQLALTYQLPLIAGNLSRSDASRVVRDGVTATFDPAGIRDYHLDRPLPEAVRAGQLREIAIGHCNMLPEMMQDGLVNAQVARDIWMARILRDQQPRDAVLIAGNDHVRKDIGVGYWLNQAEPRLSVRSIGYIEDSGSGGRYDASHHVAAQPRANPCDKLKPGR